MNVYENLKKNLKALRGSLNLTQQQVADCIKIPRANLARYETGENIPPLDVLVKIAGYYDVSVDELLAKWE